MYEHPLHTQSNSSTPGFNATCDLQGYLSRNMTHIVLPKLMAWPWNYSNSPAEYCRPQKKVSKETTYILSPKDWRSFTISQPNGGWFSQEHRPEIKFLYQRVEAHNATNKQGCPYPHKRWDTLLSPLCKDSSMWMMLSHHWLHKNRGEQSSQM
jgi:hypothetical protein